MRPKRIASAFIGLLLIVSPPVFATFSISRCTPYLQRLNPFLFLKPIPAAAFFVPSTDAEKRELRRLQTAALSTAGILTYSLNRTTYNVVGLLGKGDQASVYKVLDTSGTVFALKACTNKRAFRMNLKGFRALRKRGVDAAEVIGIDKSSNSILLEFIDGVDLKTLFEAAETNESLQPLKSQLAPIAKALGDENHNSFLYPHLGNIIYEIDTGRAVVIDPW